MVGCSLFPLLVVIYSLYKTTKNVHKLIYNFFVLVPQSERLVSNKLKDDNNRGVAKQINSPVVLLKPALDAQFNQTTDLLSLNMAVESIGL